MNTQDLIFVKGAYLAKIVCKNTFCQTDARSIMGKNVNNANIGNGKVLTYDSTSGNIVWQTPTSGGTLRSANLSPANDGDTLPTDVDVFYASLPSWPSYNVTLPDVTAMTNRELTFITVNSTYEAWLNINGPIQGSSSYTMSGLTSLKLLCDGTTWWITSSTA